MSRPQPVIRRPIVLSIGTTEPFIAAGIGLDAFIADRLDVRPVVAVAAVTAQQGKKKFALLPIPPELLQAQLLCFNDIPLAAIRIGALGSTENVHEVARFLSARPLPTVIDPVFATSSGDILSNEATIDALTSQLFPLATLVTPNITEASHLSGHEIDSVIAMDAAALAISNLGAQNVLVKGGHLKGNPVDVFWDGHQARHLEAARLPGEMRGTGCILAMSIAAALAHGNDLLTAVRIGRDVVRLIIPVARNIGTMRIAP